MIGILLLLLVPRVLPLDLDTRVAALIMGENRWNAAETMMMAENPEWANRLFVATRILNDGNEKLVRECYAHTPPMAANRPLWFAG